MLVRNFFFLPLCQFILQFFFHIYLDTPPSIIHSHKYQSFCWVSWPLANIIKSWLNIEECHRSGLLFFLLRTISIWDVRKLVWNHLFSWGYLFSLFVCLLVCVCNMTLSGSHSTLGSFWEHFVSLYPGVPLWWNMVCVYLLYSTFPSYFVLLGSDYYVSGTKML